jgi:hypothetical protein
MTEAASAKNLYLVKVGSTYPEIAARRGDFEDWTLARMGLTRREFVTLCCRTKDG